MGTMQVVRGIGASISIGGRSFTKTGIAPVVFIPAYKTLSGTVWHYWAVFGRSKIATAGTVSTPEYTAEYNLTVNGRQVYVLTLDNGAFENGTLMISGPGTINTTIQTGAASQWYDLTSVTAENAALQEAELLLRAVEQKQVAPRMPGGTSKVKETSGSKSVPNGTSTSTFTFQQDAKVVIVTATGSGYGPGTCIKQSGSTGGIVQLVSTGYFTEHSFGTYRPMYYVGYGKNVKKGTNVTLTAFQQGGTITVRYIN